MKRRLFTLALAALTIGLLGSCSKINERIDGLDNRVGNIENEKIASIENQIATINASIADLGAIRKDILDLQVAVGAKGEDISELKAADEALGQRIDELKAYVGDLSKYAEKDWVTATFATLEQLEATNTALGALEEKVNKLGETTDANIAGLKTELTNAIDSAISGINATISTLEGRVAALEAMIQTVSIVPAYSDGSVEAVDGILTLKCIVSPAEALTGMQSLKDSLLIFADSVKVKTKATTPAYMTIEVSEASVLDAAQGAITLTADISEYLPKGEDKALTVAVNIKNGISDFTTKFVPVSVAGPDIPEGALSGVFSVSATKKVHFSQGNLVATIDASGAPTAWKFSAHQYDCLGEGGANKTIGATAGDVDLFGWSTSTNVGTSTTDNYGIKTSTTTSNYSGDFYDWGKAVGDGNTWRTLSKDEWTYLFNNHSNIWATVNGVKGYVIAPDGFDGTLSSTYADDAALAANNLVFLPAAGYREGSTVYSVGVFGYYWSSTANDEYSAYRVSFGSGAVYPGNYDGSRYIGYSVRLITESN